MKIYIKIKEKTYYLNFKTILRNIIIIALLAISIKYFQTMQKYNNNLLSKYEEFQEYALSNDIPITQNTFQKYLNK